jgi:hypothetical protein
VECSARTRTGDHAVLCGSARTRRRPEERERSRWEAVVVVGGEEGGDARDAEKFGELAGV